MVLGTVGFAVHEDFSVALTGQDTLVSGIDTSEFDVELYNSNGTDVSDFIWIDISELGNGHYRVEFTPNSAGTWYMNVKHPSYFPWGKSDSIQVYTSDFNQIGEGLTRVLGLTQENYYLDNTIYIDHQGARLLTNGRLRIYSDASDVGTDSSVIATYQITSTWSGSDLTTYKVTKV